MIAVPHRFLSRRLHGFFFQLIIVIFYNLTTNKHTHESWLIDHKSDRYLLNEWRWLFDIKYTNIELEQVAHIKKRRIGILITGHNITIKYVYTKNCSKEYILKPSRMYEMIINKLLEINYCHYDATAQFIHA